MKLKHLAWAIGCYCAVLVQPALGKTPAEEGANPVYKSASSLKKQLDSLANLPDEQQRTEQVNLWWEQMKQSKQVPFISGDSVLFFYKGEAESITWQGDFTSWYKGLPGKRVGKSDVWMAQMVFPRDARLDYKIVKDTKDWMLDQANPYQQWGGAGPNSELRMPDWKPEPVVEQRTDISKGTLTDNLLFKSKVLGQELHYKVYTPAGYDNLSNLPVIYVTDGQEYSDDKLGGMVITLDNLIADKKIKPIIAVFVDPREPGNPGHNRREEHFWTNPKYAEFYVKELVPAIDKAYKTNPSADQRAILGTSFGGLNAAYFGAQASKTFHLVGIHSPAFWKKPEIFKMYQKSSKLPLKIYISTGVINDTEAEARKMKQILAEKGYEFKYREVNEGHSWGNWRALIDDVLLYFWN